MICLGGVAQLRLGTAVLRRSDISGNQGQASKNPGCFIAAIHGLIFCWMQFYRECTFIIPHHFHSIISITFSLWNYLAIATSPWFSMIERYWIPICKVLVCNHCFRRDALLASGMNWPEPRSCERPQLGKETAGTRCLALCDMANPSWILRTVCALCKWQLTIVSNCVKWCPWSGPWDLRCASRFPWSSSLRL